MKVLLIYDSTDAVTADLPLPGDFGAEYDATSAVEGLAEALSAGGQRVEMLRLNPMDFPRRVHDFDPDIAFNIAEGVRGRGRESLVPAWLQQMGIPFTGSDAVALGVSLDKALSKRLASAFNVHTPKFKNIESVEELEGIELDFPLFLKPVAEGSSMGIRESSLVKDERELGEMAEWILEEYQQPCLVEEFAPGREFCVGLLGNKDPRIFPVAEVQTEGGFYSYEQKSRHSKKLICPADISEELAREMEHMALEVFSALGCRDLARVDFKLDREGRPAFLEINPLPGLARQYGIYPHQAAAGGMEYEELINAILDAALKRGETYE